MPTSLLVLLIVLAIAGGLYVGYTASRHRAITPERPPKSLGTRAREAATRGAVGLWRWNRARKKKAQDEGGPRG
ncbi:MAG: hypothetical protein KDK70_28045 [Myxococcales bacterium]|nr:hypothetical protein [Myxococcales bacterium]